MELFGKFLIVSQVVVFLVEVNHIFDLLEQIDLGCGCLRGYLL